MKHSKIKNSILETIGNTPLVELGRIGRHVKARLCAKMERFNPMGSVKDRPALAMVESAEKAGILREGMTIVEATSGNTGLGLAMAAAVKGYSIKFLMDEEFDASPSFIKIAEIFGAEIELHKSFDEAVQQSLRLAEENGTGEYFVPQQFKNPENPNAHYETTAEEIIEATDGRLKAFVGSFGSGGTISGVGKRLKEYDPDIQIVLVEPDSVPIISRKGPIGCSYIHGIGPNFKPDTLYEEYIDEQVQVTPDEANAFVLRLAREEGIFAGQSCGAIGVKALEIAERYHEGDIIVCVFPDLGDRYLDDNPNAKS